MKADVLGCSTVNNCSGKDVTKIFPTP